MQARVEPLPQHAVSSLHRKSLDHTTGPRYDKSRDPSSTLSVEYERQSPPLLQRRSRGWQPCPFWEEDTENQTRCQRNRESLQQDQVRISHVFPFHAARRHGLERQSQSLFQHIRSRLHKKQATVISTSRKGRGT